MRNTRRVTVVKSCEESLIASEDHSTHVGMVLSDQGIQALG